MSGTGSEKTSPPDTIEQDWKDYQPTAQQEIVFRVETGELTPEAAEAEAAEIGCPIQRLPSHVLDPIAEARWTLPMLAAWVLWRTPGKVQHYWHKHRWERLEWVSKNPLVFPSGNRRQPVVRRGHRLEQPNAVDFEHVMSAAEGLGIKPQDRDVLRAEIWHHLEHGSLPATGTEPSVPVPYGQVSRRNRSASIAPGEWENLCANGGSKHHDAVFDRGTNEPAYLEVRVERAVVEKLWPNIATADHNEAAQLLVEPSALSDADALRQMIDADLILVSKKVGRQQTTRYDLKKRLLFDAAHGADFDHLKPGNRNQVRMAKDYGADRGTFRSAIADLEEHGLLSKYRDRNRS